MMKLKRIIQMLSEGKSFNAICKDTHSSKTTVSIYKKLVDDTKLPYVELLEKSDSELENCVSPNSPSLQRMSARRLCRR